jgi:hypothetical protein
MNSFGRTASLRLADALPCSLTFTQTMSVDCAPSDPNGVTVPYETHHVRLQVNPWTVTYQRHGTPTTPADEPYGVPKTSLVSLVIAVTVGS